MGVLSSSPHHNTNPHLTNSLPQIYVLIRYVTHPSSSNKRIQKSSSSSTPSSTSDSDLTPTPPNDESPPIVHLHTPGKGLSIPPGSASDTLKQLAASQSQLREPDGAILHCVSISECCFKIGRITVPPGLVMACEGFTLPPPLSSSSSSSTSPSSSLSDSPNSTFPSTHPPESYSHSNPPPHFEKVREMRKGHNLKPLREFMKGGWREVPEGERWWDTALGGEIEERRVANLELLEGVQRGMENAKTAAY